MAVVLITAVQYWHNLELVAHATHLLVGLEDVAAEGIVRHLSGDVAEDLEVLRVVRHVEYPAGRGKRGFKVLKGNGKWDIFRGGRIVKIPLFLLHARTGVMLTG